MADLRNFTCPKDKHTSLTLAVNDSFYVYFKIGYNTNSFDTCSLFEMNIYDENETLVHNIKKFVLDSDLGIVGLYVDGAVTSKVFNGYYSVIGTGYIAGDPVRYSFANMEIFNVE
jgi:hypothetical protein